MLNSGKKNALSEKKILNETKNHNPPFKLKWSVPYTSLKRDLNFNKHIL